ncbi:hypothetical protein GO684_02595 [Wolbachia endosymbiont of Litomosoides brasiliensis]|uniref:hypothetical protein n=1 Tax=Wolbachia endosymbiont of Litomosoides brasiliensis TaxID=1812117 RepID=UPI00158B34F1|nr:hypothetical protein [Wolbachia endosymbiont of Litomosoides brasiliensis]NUY39560.1 hypothetical protein [Wolbachia endosymbiont of Litomosoides brasiliensis]
MNQSQFEQVEVWIQGNLNITVKGIRIRIQEKFILNVSESTVHLRICKNEVSYITPGPIHNEQNRGR